MAPTDLIGARERIDHAGTAPLPPAAEAALQRLELAFAPVLMEFPTAFDATVVVQAVGVSHTPYHWTCWAGHDGGHGYASLPFCRDDAKAHAVECQGERPAVEVVRAVTRFENASARTAELSAAMDSRDLSPAEFDALDFAQDVMRESRATLAAAGRLDLIEVA